MALLFWVRCTKFALALGNDRDSKDLLTTLAYLSHLHQRIGLFVSASLASFARNRLLYITLVCSSQLLPLVSF